MFINWASAKAIVLQRSKKEARLALSSSHINKLGRWKDERREKWFNARVMTDLQFAPSKLWSAFLKCSLAISNTSALLKLHRSTNSYVQFLTSDWSTSAKRIWLAELSQIESKWILPFLITQAEDNSRPTNFVWAIHGFSGLIPLPLLRSPLR